MLQHHEGVTLFDKVRSSEIRKSLNIEPLLLRLDGFADDHVSRMPQERLPKQALLEKGKGKRPVGQPRTRWEDYIEDIRWNRLGLQSSKMLQVVANRDQRRLNLELLTP